MINFFLCSIIFILGLIVGSFLNCVIHRFQSGESFVKGRSSCPSCKHILSWQDLIPIFSFLFLKGRCRYCQQKISLQYPLIEIATALLFLLIIESEATGLYFQFSIFNFLNLIYYWIIAAFLIIIFVYDLKHYLIPDKVIYPAIAISLIFNSQFLISKQFSIFNYSILSAFGAALFFLLIVLLSRGKWMGLGDIKLAFLMGLFLGFPNILVALFFGIILGAIIGIGLVILGKKKLSSEIPFGPFLITGTFIALFWGQDLVNWYLHLFS